MPSSSLLASCHQVYDQNASLTTTPARINGAPMSVVPLGLLGLRRCFGPQTGLLGLLAKTKLAWWAALRADLNRRLNSSDLATV